MKNNRITVAQFWISMLLCSFYAVIFCGNTASVYELLLCAAAVVINLIVFTFYQGAMGIVTRSVIVIYFSYTALLCFVRFNEYMFKSLGYGPYWLISLIMLVFVFFCTVKGIEPIARAGGILLFFVLLALAYTFVCCFSGTTFYLANEYSLNLQMPLILLFPSAAYIVFKDNIIPKKNNVKWIYAVLTIAAVFYFMCLSYKEEGEFPFQRIAESARIDVFRGADCMLLAVFTAGGLFITSIVATALFKDSKKLNLRRFAYLLALAGASVLCLYNDYLREAIYNNKLLACVMIIAAFVFIAGIIKNLMNKNS